MKLNNIDILIFLAIIVILFLLQKNKKVVKKVERQLDTIVPIETFRNNGVSTFTFTINSPQLQNIIDNMTYNMYLFIKENGNYNLKSRYETDFKQLSEVPKSNNTFTISIDNTSPFFDSIIEETDNNYLFILRLGYNDPVFNVPSFTGKTFDFRKSAEIDLLIDGLSPATEAPATYQKVIGYDQSNLNDFFIKSVSDYDASPGAPIAPSPYSENIYDNNQLILRSDENGDKTVYFDIPYYFNQTLYRFTTDLFDLTGDSFNINFNSGAGVTNYATVRGTQENTFVEIRTDTTKPIWGDRSVVPYIYLFNQNVNNPKDFIYGWYYFSSPNTKSRETEIIDGTETHVNIKPQYYTFKEDGSTKYFIVAKSTAAGSTTSGAVVDETFTKLNNLHFQHTRPNESQSLREEHNLVIYYKKIEYNTEYNTSNWIPRHENWLGIVVLIPKQKLINLIETQISTNNN
jgi:hypothetical protein